MRDPQELSLLSLQIALTRVYTASTLLRSAALDAAVGPKRLSALLAERDAALAPFGEAAFDILYRAQRSILLTHGVVAFLAEQRGEEAAEQAASLIPALQAVEWSALPLEEAREGFREEMEMAVAALREALAARDVALCAFGEQVWGWLRRGRPVWALSEPSEAPLSLRRTPRPADPWGLTPREAERNAPQRSLIAGSADPGIPLGGPPSAQVPSARGQASGARRAAPLTQEPPAVLSAGKREGGAAAAERAEEMPHSRAILVQGPRPEGLAHRGMERGEGSPRTEKPPIEGTEAQRAVGTLPAVEPLAERKEIAPAASLPLKNPDNSEVLAAPRPSEQRPRGGEGERAGAQHQVASAEDLQLLVSGGLGQRAKAKAIERPHHQPKRPGEAADWGEHYTARRDYLAYVDDRMRWNEAGSSGKKLRFELAVAWGRHLQAERQRVGLPAEDGELFDSAFMALDGWSREHRPGSVNGMSLNHLPKGDGWLGDALLVWEKLYGAPPARVGANGEAALHRFREELPVLSSDKIQGRVLQLLDEGVSVSEVRLVNLLVPHYEALKGDGRLKPIRKAIQEITKEAEKAANERVEESAMVAATRGLKVLLVGGDRREDAYSRLLKSFAFGELEWDTGWNTKRLDGLAERVKSKSFDLVLLVRDYAKHMSTDKMVKVAKSAEVRFAVIDHGYGVAQVEASLRPLFGGESAPG